MLSKKRIPLVISIGVAIVVVLVLAAGLTGLELGPGVPYESGRGQGGGGLGAIPWGDTTPEAVSVVRAALTILAVMIPVSLIYILFNPKELIPAIRRAAIMATLAVFIYLFLRRGAGRLDELAPDPFNQSLPGGGGEVQQDIIFTTPSTAVIILIGVVVFAIFAGAIWFLTRRDEDYDYQKGTLEELAIEAQQAVDALRTGEDLKDTVMSCYFRMSRVLAERQGLVGQREMMTPREFEQRMQRAGISAEAVTRLTRLFEKVRYGNYQPTPDDEQEAIASLQVLT